MRDAHSAASSRLLAAAAHDGLQQRHGCNMQGHGRVTAESWVIGEILPLSCLRRKKKSFVIATEKGCSLFVLGEREREMVITGLERNMHLRQRSNTYFKWFRGFAPQVSSCLKCMLRPNPVNLV